MRTYTAGIGIPIGTLLSPNRAQSATATRWSHTAAVMSPPAKAYPFTAAVAGCG